MYGAIGESLFFSHTDNPSNAPPWLAERMSTFHCDIRELLVIHKQAPVHRTHPRATAHPSGNSRYLFLERRERPHRGNTTLLCGIRRFHHPGMQAVHSDTPLEAHRPRHMRECRRRTRRTRSRHIDCGTRPHKPRVLKPQHPALRAHFEILVRLWFCPACTRNNNQCPRLR